MNGALVTARGPPGRQTSGGVFYSVDLVFHHPIGFVMASLTKTKSDVNKEIIDKLRIKLAHPRSPSYFFPFFLYFLIFLTLA